MSVHRIATNLKRFGARISRGTIVCFVANSAFSFVVIFGGGRRTPDHKSNA
jgi:hypothetical protein